jgi:hypothetical protein
MIISFYPGGGGNRYLNQLSSQEWQQLGVSYDHTNQDAQEYKHRYPTSNTIFDTSVKSNILTHNLNSSELRKIFPGHDITIIKGDIQSCLRREWMLHGHDRWIKKVSNTTISKLEHYRAIMDSSWPDIADESMLCQLPSNIANEVEQNYQSVINARHNHGDPVAMLVQECTDQIHSAYDMIVWHQQYYNNYPEDVSCATSVIDLSISDSEFAQIMKQELNLYRNQLFDKVWNKFYECN